MKYCLLFAAGLMLISGCTKPSPHPRAESEPHPEVRAYGDAVLRASKLANAPDIEMREFGTVAHAGSEYPLFAFSRPAAVEDGFACLLTGSIHGNEPAAGEALFRFLEELAGNPDLFPEVSFTVIPIQNPFGWVHDVRGSGNGEDINRDFASKRTQEAVLIREFLSRYSFDLAIDHHEDPNSTGCYVYEYAPGKASLAPLFIEYLVERELPVETEVSFSILKVENGIISAPLWGLRYQRLTRKLSSTNWLRLRGIRHTYTIETPTSLDFEERVGIHLDTIRLLLKGYRSVSS